MRRVRFLYAILIAVLVSFYILYIDYLPLVMLCVALVIPVLMWLGTIWLHFTTDCSLSVQSDSCRAGDAVPVTITVRNRSPLFCARADAVLRLHHGFGSVDESLQLRFPIRQHNSTRMTFQIRAAYCGEITVELKRLTAFDLLLLTSTRIRRQMAAVKLTVLPRPVLIPLEETAPHADHPDSEKFADHPGDDPSEVFGIREYQPGDAVSRMHWKLSSRSDTMYVKEFSAPIEKNCVILCEYHYPAEKQPYLQDAQAFLTLVYSLACEIISRGHICEICWCNGSAEEAVRTLPESEEAIIPVFREMLDHLRHMDADEEKLLEQIGGTACASATVITNHPDSKLPEFAAGRITANQRNVLLIAEESVQMQLPPDTNYQCILARNPHVDHLIV